VYGEGIQPCLGLREREAGTVLFPATLEEKQLERRERRERERERGGGERRDGVTVPSLVTTPTSAAFVGMRSVLSDLVRFPRIPLTSSSRSTRSL
jgi:hypothetical protein